MYLKLYADVACSCFLCTSVKQYTQQVRFGFTGQNKTSPPATPHRRVGGVRQNSQLLVYLIHSVAKAFKLQKLRF